MNTLNNEQMNTLTNDEIHSLKIIQLITNIYDIKIDFTKKGFIYHKRKHILQNTYKYIVYKHCKKLNIRTMEQLNNLYNIYQSNINNIYINLHSIINKSNNKVNKINNKTRQDFNYKYYRYVKYINNINLHIRRFGKKLFNISIQEFNKCHFIPTSYGYIDYYNQIILFADININNMYDYLFNNFNKHIIKYKTNDNGFIRIKHNGFIQCYDLGHRNTIFTYWNKNNITRLYYNNNNFIKVDKIKSGCNVKSNYY